MSDAFRKVQTGDPLRIPAPAYNAFLDAAAYTKAQLTSPTRSPNGGLSDAAIVLVRNLTGGNLPLGAIVQLGSILVDVPSASDPSKILQDVVVEGVAPSAGSFRAIGVLRDAIPDGKIGRVQVEGVVPARLFLDSVDHRFADVIAGSTLLRSRSFGRFEILSLASGATASGSEADLRWALVRRLAGESVRFLARITAAVEETTHKWVYTWEEVTLNTSGNPTLVSGGRTSAACGEAINLFERSNTGSGVEGNGVDRANVPPGFEMKPAPVGLVVWLEGPSPRLPSAPWWTFFYSNADDGMC